MSYVCHTNFNHGTSVYLGTHRIMLGVPFFPIPTCTLDTLFPFYGHLSALAGGTGERNRREGECTRLMSGEMGVSGRENLCSCMLSRQKATTFRPKPTLKNKHFEEGKHKGVNIFGWYIFLQTSFVIFLQNKSISKEIIIL